MNKNKPAVGTLAHYEYHGISDDRLVAMRLPSRVGNTLTYPRAYYEHQKHLADKKNAKASIQPNLKKPQISTSSDCIIY